MKISLLLVDDHPFVREGIRSFFSGNRKIEVLGEAANGSEAIEAAGRLRPDIVLMDINMPGINGLEATRLLRQKMPGIKVIILTMHDSKEYVAQIARVGAQGYVLKDSSPDQLVEAIQEVYAGKRFFAPKIAGQLAELVKEHDQLDPRQGPSPVLSERELQVLGLLAQGLSNKEIAPRTALSVGSVKTYRRRIMIKLGIHHTAGLTKYALEHGLIPAGK